MQSRLQKEFEKEGDNRLWAECSRLALIGSVGDTPEIDLKTATFLRKLSKDPKRGIDRT